MARGRDKHQARLAALSGLGRNLSRRARSSCELCGERAPLRVVEVAGGPEPEPSEDWAVMLCERCQRLEGQDPQTLRFLETAMWSETLPAQILAVRALRALAASGAQWPTEALEGLWLDEAVEALI